jgi:alpha-tubulin suppressor-like RCC1 family protein
VACGGSASLALTATGDVFVWGAGVLGFGPDVVDIKHPRRLPRPYFGAFDDADAMADSNKGRQG